MEINDITQFLKDYVPPWVAFVANLATACGFMFGLYLYFTKKEKIDLLYKVIIGLKNQESFRELTKRLDHLDRLNIDTKEQRLEATHLLAEVLGQLKSNPVLAQPTIDVRNRLQAGIDGDKRIGESAKRQLCSELRELLRSLNYETISRFTEGNKP